VGSAGGDVPIHRRATIASPTALPLPLQCLVIFVPASIAPAAEGANRALGGSEQPVEDIKGHCVCRRSEMQRGEAPGIKKHLSHAPPTRECT
jgi:hypothetical protein